MPYFDKDNKKYSKSNSRTSHQFGGEGYSKEPNEILTYYVSKHAVEIVVVVVALAVSLFAIRWSIKNFEMPSRETAAQKEKRIEIENYIEMNRIAKEKRLDESFEDVMFMGDLNLGVGTNDEAVDRYFDAKSIYPYRLEPRIALAEAYLERCKGKEYYCRYVAKELFYAQYYVTDSTTLEQKTKLVQLQNQLDQIYTMKDSSFIRIDYAGS